MAPAQEEFGGIAFEDEAYFGTEAVEQWLAEAVASPAATHDGVDYWRVEWDDEPYAGLRSQEGNTVLHGLRYDGARP